MRFTSGSVTYLDHLTITPVLDEALNAFIKAMGEGYGNIRSSNLPGRKALSFQNRASEEVASFFGGRRAFFYPDGGMATGLVLASLGRSAREKGRGHIVASCVETTPVITYLRMLNGEGSDITFIPCGSDGCIQPGALREGMTERTGLVTVAWGSGISGIVQPVEELAEIAHSGGAFFHSDAAVAAGRIEIDLSSSEVDVITIDSHRLGGIPGTGAVISSLEDPWIMSRAPELPGLTGVPGIAALLAALGIINTGIRPRARLVTQLRSELLEGLDRLGIGYSIVGCSLDNLIPGAALLHMSATYQGLHARMEDQDVILPSHLCTERLAYMKNLGLEVNEEAQERFLGFSFGPTNTILEVEHFLRALSMSKKGKTNCR